MEKYEYNCFAKVKSIGPLLFTHVGNYNGFIDDALCRKGYIDER